MQTIEWCHFRWPWVTPDPGFKVTVVLKGEYLQFDAFYRHSYCIGHHRHAIDRQPSYSLQPHCSYIKPCKLFASVARVCQRQLGFLVCFVAKSEMYYIAFNGVGSSQIGVQCPLWFCSHWQSKNYWRYLSNIWAHPVISECHSRSAF